MTRTTGIHPLRRSISESNGQVQRQKERARSKSLQFEPTLVRVANNKDIVGTEKTSTDLLIYLTLALISLVKDDKEHRKYKLSDYCKNYKNNSHKKSKDQEAQTNNLKNLMNGCPYELASFDLGKPFKNIQGYDLANARVPLQKLYPFLYEDYLNCVNLMHVTIIKAFPLIDYSRNFEEYVQKELSVDQSNNSNNSSLSGKNPHSMNLEIIRIGTFSSFPRTDSVSTVRLAKEGFYYTGEGDKVACFACGVHRSGRRANDEPRQIHQQLSPNCSFLNSGQSENVPMQEEENIAGSHTETQPREDSGESTSEHFNQTGERNILQNSTLSMSSNEIRQRESTRSTVPTFTGSNSTQQGVNLKSSERQERARPRQRSRALQEKVNVFLRSLDPLGINFDRPKYPAYAVVATRVSSFNDWPPSITQTPRDLALAGFLYVGYGDYTRCFFCGGGLRNWEPGDDPWIEHARWFPKCAFLRQNKGDEFVALVQIEHNEMEASEEAMNAEEGATSTRCRSNIKPTGREEKNIAASDIFDLVSVHSVLEMGYTRQAVKEAFDLLRNAKHVEEISGEDLIDVILSKEENSTRSDIQPATRNSEPKLVERNDTGYTNGSTKKEDKPNIGSSSGAKDSPSTIGSLDSSNNSLPFLSIEDTKSLIEENRKLKDLRLCKICLENEASIAMLPCGHLCCCPDCAPAMRKCPICRQFVKGTVRTWLV